MTGVRRLRGGTTILQMTQSLPTGLEAIAKTFFLISQTVNWLRIKEEYSKTGNDKDIAKCCHWLNS